VKWSFGLVNVRFSKLPPTARICVVADFKCLNLRSSLHFIQRYELLVKRQNRNYRIYILSLHFIYNLHFVNLTLLIRKNKRAE